MSTVPTTVLSEADGADTDTGRLVDASRGRLLAVVVAIVLYTEVLPLQVAMVGAGVQKITKSFPTVGANISWTIIIVALVGASLTPLLGKMADIWGKRRIFVLCGVVFVVGAVICALTSSWTLFLVGRGLSAAAIATQVIAYGLLRDLLPRKYVALGLGASATGLGFSAIMGPIIGGYLVDNYDWRALFWFLAIFTIVMIPVVLLVVPESKLRVKDRLDLVGAALLAAGIALVLIYLDKGQEWGWGRPTTLAWVIGGVVLLGLFFVVEFRTRRPIMNMRLLLSPTMGAVLLFGFLGPASCNCRHIRSVTWSRSRPPGN
ncbi:MFS transporter [Nocardia sp. BMG111209]|uniref:MFS transporter n=1 Tax=Nocardia sp. BMG111209 TaxID=1160137 RepID=UPI001E6028AD|nr:MFS transporter [Nocardia sp. BMG111209]